MNFGGQTHHQPPMYRSRLRCHPSFGLLTAMPPARQLPPDAVTQLSPESVNACTGSCPNTDAGPDSLGHFACAVSAQMVKPISNTSAAINVMIAHLGVV